MDFHLAWAAFNLWTGDVMRHRVNTAQFNREREQLERDLQIGLISHAEYSLEMRELDRAERDAFQEAAGLNAEQAYRDTMEW